MAMDEDLKKIGRGTLMLMDWIEDTSGDMLKGYYGDVYVGTDVETVGFAATGHNTANWVARVEGETEAITLMGCQVRAFREAPEPPRSNIFKVLA